MTLITKACKDGSKDDTDAELKRGRRHKLDKFQAQ